MIRDAREADMVGVQAIYAHYVLHEMASFEEAPPSADELLSRRASVLGLNLPYLVAEMDGRVVGYSYASRYRSQTAYRLTIEDSVYVADEMRGHGIGTALLQALIARCEAGPWRQMIGIIGHTGGAASIALHKRLGFRPVGTVKSVGFKFGQWCDTDYMQRSLGVGDTNLPT